MSISHPLLHVASMGEFNAVFETATSGDVRRAQSVDRVLAYYMQRISREIDVEEERQANAAHDALAESPSNNQLTNRYLPFLSPPPPTPHDARASVEPEAPVLHPQVVRPTPVRNPVARRRASNGMLLISVKRQRKLKMKKHKYKKLMKRTRLERRKLDKL